MKKNCRFFVRHVVLLLFVIFTSFELFSANYYWVGGTGTWNQLSHWASSDGGAGGAYASQPGSADNVFFTSASGITAATIITFTPGTTSTCKNLVFNTGVVGYKISGISTSRLDLNGNLTLEPGMVFSGWLGSLWFYQDNTSLVNTITTANNILRVREVHFETPSSGTGGNFVVNDVFSLNGNPVSVDINLQSATNTVLFNEHAFLGYTQTLHKGIMITPKGFDCMETSLTSQRFEVHSEGTLRNDGDIIFNHLYNYGTVYLNYSNTPEGNTISSKVVTVQGSNPYTVVPPVGFTFMLDLTNCHFFVKQFWNYGTNNGASVPNPVNIVATGSTIQFTSTATSMTWLNHTFHNIIVDENPTTEFGFTHTIENNTDHIVHVDSLIIDRTTNFITPSNQRNLDLRIHNLLHFTAGHSYTSNFTYHKFNMLTGAKLDMQGTCDQPIWLQGTVFDVTGVGTVVTSNLIFRSSNSSSPGTISAGAGSRIESGGSATGWTFGALDAPRTLVWVGPIPSNTSDHNTYGNWYNDQNWCDVTSMPGGIWSGDALNAPGNPGHCGSVCPPTEIDSVIFPNNSYVFCDKPIMSTEGMNWLQNGRIYGTSIQDLEVWGSLHLSPQMINDFGGTFRFRSNRPYRCSITTNNQPFDYGTAFRSQNGLGSWLLMDTLKVPILDPEVNGSNFNYFSVGVYSGHLYTGTASCTNGNGQTIMALGLTLFGGQLSLFDSDVYIQNAPSIIQGSSDINTRPAFYVWTGTLNAGTSNIILERKNPSSASSGIIAFINANYVLYDITFRNADLTIASLPTHGLRLYPGIRIHNVFAENNTYPVYQTNSNAVNPPRIQKSFGNSNYKLTVCAENHDPLASNFNNAKVITLDTVQFAKGVDFKIRTNIHSLLQMYPSGIYSLGDISNSIQVIFSSATNTASPFQCGAGSITYPQGGKLVANGNCALGSAYVNFGEFVSNSTATHIADFANVNNNIVTGTNSPINTTNGLFVGVTTGWAGASAVARKLHWVDGSSVAGNTGDFQDPNHWEQLLPFYAPAPQCPPVLVDTVLFDNTSFSANNQIVSLTGVTDVASMYWKNITAGTNPTMVGANLQQLRLRGSLEFDPNMVNQHTGNVLFSGVPSPQFPTFTIKTGSIHFINDINFVGDNDLTEWHLLDSIYQDEYNVSTTRMYLTRGRLFTDGFSLNIPAFHSAGTSNRYLDITNTFVTLRSSNAGVSGVWNYDWKITGTVVNGQVQNFGIKTDFSTLFSKLLPPPYHQSQNPRDYYELGGFAYNKIISESSKLFNLGPNSFRRDTISYLLVHGGVAPIGVNHKTIDVDSIYIVRGDIHDPITIGSEGGTYDSLYFYENASITTSNRYEKVLHFEPAKNYLLSASTVQWIKNEGNLELNGGSTATPIQFYGTPTGSQAYIRKDTTLMCADFVNIRDVWAIGNGDDTPNSCTSYGISPVNNNTAHPNPWIVSMADTITDITSSCGPWYGNNPASFNRGRADFNAGPNADLQDNAWGWGKRVLPPLPFISLTDYTTVETCQGDTLVYGIEVVGDLPVTISDTWIIDGDTTINTIVISDASDFESGTGVLGNPYLYITSIPVPETADTIVVTNLQLEANRCSNNYAENLQEWLIIVNPTPYDLAVDLLPTSNSVCFGENPTVSGSSSIPNITYTLSTTIPTIIGTHVDGGSVNTGAIVSDTSFVFSALTSKGCSVDTLLTFIIGDITPPTLTCVDDTLIAPPTACSYTLQDFTTYPAFNVTDDCSDEVDIIVNQLPLPGIVYNPGDTATIWLFAEDESGNIDSCSFELIVGDTTAPIFTNILSQDTIYSNCINGIPQPEVLILTDNCTTATMYVDELQININCWSDYTIKRDYYAVDEYGNYSDTLTQYIIVIDTVAPVFDNIPLDDTLYFSCTDIIPLHETLNASGECVQDFARWNGNNTLMQNGLLFRVGDALAGYNSTTTGYGTIVSNALVTDYLTGASPAQLAYFNGITFSITTDSLPGFTGQNANHGTGFNTYGYRLTNAAYEITFSDDVMYAVNGNPGLEYQEKSEFYGDFELLVPYDFNNGNWTGTSSFAGTGVVADLTAPTLSLQKIENIASPINRLMAGGRGTFFGNSNTKFAQMFEAFLYVPDTLVRYETDTIAGSCSNEMTINRRWIAEDSCGNQNIFTQLLIVQDLESPTFVESLPTDTTVNCDAIPTALTLTATDNCSSSVTVNFEETAAVGSCANAYTLTRTWTATDDCNNTTTHVQTIMVQDTVAPTFVEALPQDTTVNCDAIPTALTLTATDNCSSSVTVNFEETTAAGSCANAYTLTRIWTATDECNNTTTHIQTITVQDTLAPTFVEALPQDTTVNCDAIPTALTLTATDNCSSSVTVNFEETTAAGSCANAYTLTRTWTATDDCNNTTTHVQTITVQDTFAPTFVESLPTDTTVNCDAIPTALTLTATDNCSSSVTVNFEETTAAGSCADAYTLTRTWTATDECNNTTTHVQTIMVQDTVAPTFVEALPQDTTVNCDAIPTALTLTATDNCSSSVTVNFEETTAAGSCANAYTLTRTWTATDECNNTTTHIQTITVQDTLAPAFVESLPQDTTVNCDAIPTALTLTATDNCSSSVTVNFEETTAAGSCANASVITRTWTATDECDNTTIHVQVINVQDTVAPVIIDCPSDIAQNNDADVCGAIVTWTAPTATDNCTSTVSVTSSHQPNTFFPVGTTQVRYVFTDECANVDSCMFNVVITDVQKPNVSVIIAENFCADEQVSWQQIVSDNCAIATVELTHEPTFDFPEGDTEVSLTVTDIHGNDSTITFTVTVVPMPIAEIEVSSGSSENTTCLDTDLTFTSSTTSSTNTYTWYFNGVEVGTGTIYTIADVTFDHAGLYSLEIENEFGCLSVDTFTLAVKSCDITIFESFSPNGDGKNEFFYVEGLENFPNTKVIIYNRWGTEVFQSDDYQNDWDGRSQSKYNVGGDELPEASYFYLLELGGNPEDATYGKIYKGYVYLKR